MSVKHRGWGNCMSLGPIWLAGRGPPKKSGFQVLPSECWWLVLAYAVDIRHKAHRWSSSEPREIQKLPHNQVVEAMVRGQYTHYGMLSSVGRFTCGRPWTRCVMCLLWHVSLPPGSNLKFIMKSSFIIILHIWALGFCIM